MHDEAGVCGVSSGHLKFRVPVRYQNRNGHLVVEYMDTELREGVRAAHTHVDHNSTPYQ